MNKSIIFLIISILSLIFVNSKMLRHRDWNDCDDDYDHHDHHRNRGCRRRRHGHGHRHRSRGCDRDGYRDWNGDNRVNNNNNNNNN